MGMKFAIRDDDTSFFTSPEELKRAYDFLQDGCVSLSIVPFTVARHTDASAPYGDRPLEKKYYDIKDNPELVSYLREEVKKGTYEVLLHGYNHEYQRQGTKWIPEMIWKDKTRLLQEITDGKRYLEQLLDTKIRVLAAPSNAIDQKGIAALEKNDLDFCGIIHGFQTRKFDARMAVQFLKRWSVRVTEGIQYPGVMKYTGHLECNAYPLNDMELLKKEYRYCKERGIPFVIYTHYWKLNEDPDEKKKLLKIYDMLMKDHAKCIPVSQLFTAEGK